MTNITTLRPSRPVEHIPNGARVTVDLSPQLGLVIDGTVTGCAFGAEHRYDVDLGLDGMRLIGAPGWRVKREDDVA